MSDDPSYSYKPALIGAPSEFRLTPAGLAWSIGRRSGVIRYERIGRVRLSFRPVTMQSHRFTTEIWSSDAQKIQIASTSWRTIVDQQRQDGAYGAFIAELHRRLAATGSGAAFVTGLPIVQYGLGVVVLAAMIVAFVMIMVRALQNGQMSGAAIVAGIFALFGWQVGQYFLRNRPGTYRPDALPAVVLPREER